MKFSLDWLSDFADLREVDPAAIAATANEIGLEIGTVEAFSEGSFSDTVFDADVTPNRPDAMNHRGFARDIAAGLGLAFPGSPPPEKPDAPAPDPKGRVTIEVPDRCRRFAVRELRGVGSGPSPAKWARRMRALGLKEIDLVVDATNISLWGIGQPLHAFDADRVAGGRLVVRFARPGETLLCLDGVERRLDPEDVVVADEERALSLAGVIGGADSAIRPGVTRNVLLEAAWWDPVSIRRTARRHGLHTDASHRYERGADIEAIPEGLALAAGLIRESRGGEAGGSMVDACPRPFVPKRATLRLARLRALSGLPELSLGRAIDILERLGFGVEARGDTLEAVVPSWRPDVSIEEDLIEEVVRIEGYSKIPSLLPAATNLSPLYLGGRAGEKRAARETEDRVSDAAVEAGLDEAMNFPFVSPEREARFGNLTRVAEFRAQPLVVANPLDATRPGLRRLLLPGLLEAAALNVRNGRRSVALFEIGRVWDRSGEVGVDPAEIESRHFAFVLAGEAGDFPPRPADVLDAKGIFCRVIAKVTGGKARFRAPDVGFFPPSFGLDVYLGEERVGALGRLPESMRSDGELPPGTVGGEIDLAVLDRELPGVRFREYSRFPAADLDMTVPTSVGTSWGEIEEAVRGAHLALFESLRLLELYEDPARPGIRHVTFRLTFRAPDRTLSQEEVNRERDRLFEILKQKFGETP